MGRGPVVERKKSLSNAAKGKVFSIHAKLISLAAQKGGDPDLNPALYDAIEKAKKDNVPNDNIQRAIKKGSGEDKEACNISQIIYEGYGPSGVGFMITTITDNKNRTVSNIRHIFSKYGGNMGESGSVSFIFERMGVIIIDLEKYSFSKLEEIIFEMDFNISDYFEENHFMKIFVSIDDLVNVRKYLENKDIQIESYSIDFIPKTETEVSDFDNGLKLTKMIQAFEEDEDVEIVSNNMIINEELQKQINEFIEKNTFRT